MRTMAQALGQTLAEAMALDERVVLLGDEILEGGLHGVTEGLLEKFGPERVLEPGGGEAALVDFALGAALQGLRPVVELAFSDGILAALGSVAELAELAWRSGGGFRPHVVIRCPYGSGLRSTLGARSPEALLCGLPGLAVAAASDPESAAALLALALQADGPVVLLEPRALYHRRDLEAADPAPTRLGQAVQRRTGSDVAAICWGPTVPHTLEAARILGAEQISVEVLDLLSLSPLDEAALLGAVERSGRPVLVHEGPATAGFGAELAARIAAQAVLWLESPVLRVAGAEEPASYAADAAGLPSVQQIARALRQAAFY